MPNAGVGACPSDMEIDHNIFGTVLAVSRVSPMAPRHFPFISKGIFTLTSALIYSLFPCCAVVSGGPNSRPPRKYFVLFKPFLLSARAHIDTYPSLISSKGIFLLTWQVRTRYIHTV